MKMISAFVPVLRCSLMRTLISSSWWRSEVSRSGRRSPTLGCSLAMVVSVLEGWTEGRSEGVRPFLPAWSTPGATHQNSLQAPLHHTTVNSHTSTRTTSYLGLAATWHQLDSEKQQQNVLRKAADGRVWWLTLTWLLGYSRRRNYGWGGTGTSNS